MVKADIIRLIELRLKITHDDANKLVEDILETIKDRLVNKESVLISGFGHWKVRFKKQRRGRNPKTGKEHPVNARHVITFYPSSVWRNEIAEKFAEVHLSAGQNVLNSSTERTSSRMDSRIAAPK